MSPVGIAEPISAPGEGVSQAAGDASPMNRGVSVTIGNSGRPQPRRRPTSATRPAGTSETHVRNWRVGPHCQGFRDDRGIRIGYARVSTREQNTDGQLDAQQRPGANVSTWTRPRARWAGRRSRDRCREQLRCDDALAVTMLDRMGHSVRHLDRRGWC